MSWGRDVWGKTVWHTPDGRPVSLPEGDGACDVQVEFDDGTTRDLTVQLAGRKVVRVLLDGVPCAPADGGSRRDG